MVANVKGSRWNRVASSLISLFISTSGFGDRHFLNSVVDQRRKMSRMSTVSYACRGPGRKCGVAVDIAFVILCGSKAIGRWLQFLRQPSWISGKKGDVGFFSTIAPLISPDPKWGGVAPDRVSRWSLGEVRGRLQKVPLFAG